MMKTKKETGNKFPRIPIQIHIPIISDKQNSCPYEEPYGYIYLVRNLINGHMYIGKHEFHKPYLDKTYKGSGKRLKRAYKKHGIENFSMSILEWVQTNNNDLNQAEIYWIDMFNSYVFPNHYNQTPGGDDAPVMCGKDNPMYGKTGVNSTWYGRLHTKEEKMKISKANKGKKLSDLTKEKLRISHMNPSEETRRKISKNHADFSGSKHPRARKVRCIEIDKKFDCMKDAYLFLGINPKGVSEIAAVCRGRKKTAYGYHWEYIDID